MAVPFGFSIGDFLAISKVIYNIGLELKKNSKAAPGYQLLLIELESLDRTLKLLQCIEPAQYELKRLEAIRALASTCQRPLEGFLERIRKFDDHLGSRNSNTRSLSSVGRRLQWSMGYENQVKSLRAKLAPIIATMTILLSAQTMDTLLNAESDHVKTAEELNCKIVSQCSSLTEQSEDLNNLQAKTDELLRNNIAQELHISQQAAVLSNIQHTGVATNARGEETCIIAKSILQDTAEIKATVPSIVQRALYLIDAATLGISTIQDIAKLLSRIIKLTKKFTLEMRETMTKVLQAFGNIQRQLTQLERSMPKQIDLPIVRFRDAFNVTRAFPFDLCKEWRTFQGLLAVIFMNRQGMDRVNRGRYFVTNVRIGQKLNPLFWSNAIEPGDELSMTMILDDVEAVDGFCPYKSCGALITHVAPQQGGKVCPNCFRFSAISQKNSFHGQESIDWVEESFTSPTEEQLPGPKVVQRPRVKDVENEDIELYQSIQVARMDDMRLNDFGGFTFYRAFRNNDFKEPLSRATWFQIRLSRTELARMVLQKKKKMASAEQYGALKFEGSHVDRLIEIVEKEEPRFQWTCVYADTPDKVVKIEDSRRGGYKSRSMNVIIQGKLKQKWDPYWRSI